MQLHGHGKQSVAPSHNHVLRQVIGLLLLMGEHLRSRIEQEETEDAQHPLGLETTFSTSQVVSFVRNLMGIIHMSSKVQKGDIIVLQYPVKKYFSLICRIAHRRGAKTIALIHDLGCMRRKKLTEQEEITRLMHADGVIATNAVMMQWLKEKGYTKTLDYLGLHDYLSDSVSRPPVQHSPLKVVYAGTLALRKNAFLMDMAKQVGNYELVIYGKHKGLPRLQTRGHIKVNPFLSADTFIREVEGDFGLVWDGDSLDTCSGHFGEYLRWNTPQVQDALERLMKTRTTVAIAHRLSTIKNSDEICVLHEGRIVERGSHEQLLNSDGYYKKLHEMQS